MYKNIFFKKIGIILLILAMAMTSFPTATAQDVEDYLGTDFYQDHLGTNVNRAWFDTLKDLNIIPALYTYSIQVKGETFYANEQLFDHLGLIVYGDHSVVPQNNFKEKATGYYRKSGKRGEYRYEGYSFNGVPFANNRFPRDSDSGRAMRSKTWIYKPWEEDSKGYQRILYNLTDPLRASEYNIDVIDRFNQTSGKTKNMYAHLIAQINETAPFQIEQAAYTVDEPGRDVDVINGNRDMINYGIVQQTPTSYASGSVFLTHYNYSGEAVTAPTWYQTTSLERLSDKLRVDLDGGLTVLDKTYHKETGIWTYTLAVYALVEDNFIYDGSLEENIFQHYRQAYRNREDLKYWDLEISTNEGLSLSSQDASKLQTLDYGRMEKIFLETHIGDPVYGTNAASKTIHVNIHESELEKLPEGGEINFIATATATYFLEKDNVYQTDSIVLGDMSSGNIAPPPPVEPEPVDLFEVEVTAPKEIIDAWDFDLQQNIIDGSALEDIEVILDGQLLNDSDEALFLSGNYKFPRGVGDKLYTYRINYITSLMQQDEEGEPTDIPIDMYYESYVLVYDPTPRIDMAYENYGKINRRIVLQASIDAMPQFVKDNTNTSIDIFNVTTQEDIGLSFAENSRTRKGFLVKEPGSVDIYALATNQYASSTYTNNIYQMADLRPDIVAMIWNNNLARGESLDILAEAASVDGDSLEAMPYDIWYGKEEGTYTEKVYEGTWQGSTDYVPDRLGFYEITWTVKEVFGEPTYEAYVSEEDRLTHTVKREFSVSNVVPMTKLYTDIEYNFPELDVAVIIDQNASTDLTSEVKSNDVNIRNFFRTNAMVADLNIWDTKTYTFNTTASRRVHSGSSYPSSTYYYSSGGYSGTLNRVSVDDQGSYHDYGGYQTVTDSKTAYDSRSASGTSPPGVSRSAAGVPTSLSYSSSGYTGTLYESSYSYDSWPVVEDGVESTWKYHWSRSASYAGTVTKSSTTWVPDYRWISNYYGNYSGTAYRNVKEPYTSSFSVESNKYIIYVSNTGINSQVDFEGVRDEAPEAEIYLVSSSPSHMNGIEGGHHYIYQDGRILEIIEDIVKDIKTQNPIDLAYTLLPGENFSLNFVNMDYEEDPIIEDKAFYYEHHANYFDNPTGQEPDTNPVSDGTWTSAIKNNFNSVGKYIIRRKVTDAPIGDESLGLESNIAEIEILVHRKPFADYDLDWTYNPDASYYETTWVDKSYDLDFQYSDPINKGIINRKIKYRRNNGPWIYEIPKQLAAGTYDLEYIVQDNFGVWSDVKSQSFILEDAPGIQVLQGQLKTVEPEFSLDGIPHTEALLLYDVVTRYPYEHRGYLRWYKNNQAISQALPLGVSYENQGPDRLYNPFILLIDKKMTNSTYGLRLTFESLDGSKETHKDFQVVVDTPINLEATMADTFYQGDLVVQATTSKYVDRVEVLAFKGSPLETNLLLNLDEVGQWSGVLNVGESIDPGLYDFEYTAWVDAQPAFSESVTLQSEKKALNVAFISLDGDWSYYERAENIFSEPLVYDGHRFLSLERLHLNLETIGSPDQVVITLPDAFIQAIYTNSKGQTYDNRQWVDLKSKSFALTKLSDNTFYTTFDLPIVDSTLSKMDERLRPPYQLVLRLEKNSDLFEYVIDDVEVTGNVFDHIYLQPKLKEEDD